MRIALIGYGEVGRILAEDLHARGHELNAFDIKLAGAEARETMREHAHSFGVTLTESHADAVRHADLVVSAVTASQTVPAAQVSAGALFPNSFFLDLNSASPSAKIAAARHISSAGGRYVEGAVMTAVPLYRIRVPLLLGGPHASLVEPVLNELGFAAKVGSSELGVASATKMCRSVMIKGLEAMLIESFTAARHYGVEASVIASLRETFPGIDWERQATYFFQRVTEHGRRRSEEMSEAALTVRDAGLEPWSATGTRDRQAWVADLDEQGIFGDHARNGFERISDWRRAADRILDHVKHERGC